ncbi:MAG: DUF819 family protein [Candidatus Cyclobacteriaceae bacterium M3_2C_046]
MENEVVNPALITNDAVVLGLLMVILALVFYTASSSRPGWQKFYKYVPSLLLCYFIPAIFNSLGIISGEDSNLYFVSSRYLLPTSLVLLTLSIDLKGIMRLGPKAVIMFLAGTVGIVIGGPLAIMIISTFSPDLVGGAGPDAVWRGLATIAGSWIGGGANQAAMFEVFEASPDLFAAMIAVDVIVANIWMAFLLYGAGRSAQLDKVFKADASAIADVQKRIEDYRLSIAKLPKLTDTMVILGIGFGATGIAHLLGDFLAPWIKLNFPALDKFSLTSEFFWIVVVATTIGLILSFTRAKKFEGVGASRLGSAMLYVLVATVGMKMDIGAVAESPGYFMIGLIWMAIHVIILLSVGKLIKAPFFFIAVGSQANVGGAASAPIVASAFNPSLAPVGVLLAVLGYALGTYAAWFCGILMQAVSP